MDSEDKEWASLGGGGLKAGSEASSDVPQKPDPSSLLHGQCQAMFEDSNIGGEDDYMTSLGLYDGYDSYNDSGGTTEEDENYDSSLYPAPSLYQQDKAAAMHKKNMRYSNAGMAVCEQCQAVGMRSTFYSKSKRFCSLSCSRSFATAQREGKLDASLAMPLTKKNKRSSRGRKSKSPLVGVQNLSSGDESKAFDWGSYLISSSAAAAQVSCFPHVPMSDGWEQIGEGMKVEVSNMDCELPYPVYWIASVVKMAGYNAMMRYEGFGNDPGHDFWVSLVSPEVHPVGWCATKGKPLVPPQSIQTKYSDWKDFLVRQLTGSRTLPDDFYKVFQECLHNHKLRRGMRLEVINKMCVSGMRVASISDIIGGRLRLTYMDREEEGDDFWCHMKSPLIHPVGWSQTVGHRLHASQEYRNATLSKIAMEKYDEMDVSPEMMPKLKEPFHEMQFAEGMKLEAIDPLNLSSICVATVMKVLRNGYLMIGIDGSDLAKTGHDWFCYHSSSPCIFPVGFCQINKIDLSPPKGYKGMFKWFDYLKQTQSVAAPVKLFDKDIPKHGLRPGMKVEGVDLMEPRLVCVATVTRVVGRLLRIHFDGWDNEYDQWLDCQSPDLYPVGWCHAMDYPLEGPRIQERMTPMPMLHKKKKTKNQIYKGPRKKRKSKGGVLGNPFPPGYRFLTTLPDALDTSLSAPGDPPGGVKPPPHTPLSSEAVAANLPPLLDPDLPPPSKKIKQEAVEASPMEVSTAVAPSSHPPHPHSHLPALSPKGGLLPDSSPASQPPISMKAELPDTDSASASVGEGSSAGEGHASSSDAAQNGNPSAGSADRGDKPLAFTPSLEKRDKPLAFTPSLEKRAPHTWSPQDVCLFLSVNHCGGCCQAVLRRNLGGRELLALNADQQISLAGTKVGPSLRITQLLQQLRSHAQAFPSADSPAMDTH